MFTGIIESVGIIDEVSKKGSNAQFWISSPITAELKPDQSLCHDGVCLTVEEISGNKFKVSAIDETLKKTNLIDWKKGQKVNLERSMQLNGRFDGHIVQGHVDTTARCWRKMTATEAMNLFLNLQRNFHPPG
jgi:riboflavin synthase